VWLRRRSALVTRLGASKEKGKADLVFETRCRPKGVTLQSRTALSPATRWSVIHVQWRQGGAALADVAGTILFLLILGADIRDTKNKISESRILLNVG
jgi:hypothetical protein